MGLWEKRRDIALLMRLDRPYGTLLLMLPTLWSLFMASAGRPTIKHLIVFTLGSFLMRSAGCVMNDMADSNFDAQVTRTQNRPLAKGVLTHTEAFCTLIILLSFSFLLVLTLNRLTILLSFAALLFAALYPFAKRFTHFAQVVLGATFSFGILMAWTAVRDEIAPLPFFIMIANIFWACGYDTIYALMDREDDMRVGVKSTAVFFGSRSGLAIGLSFAFVIFFLALMGQQAQMGSLYFLSLSLAAAAFLYQTILLQKPLERERLFLLFKAHVPIGGIILVGIVLDRVWLL